MLGWLVLSGLAWLAIGQAVRPQSRAIRASRGSDQAEPTGPRSRPRVAATLALALALAALLVSPAVALATALPVALASTAHRRRARRRHRLKSIADLVEMADLLAVGLRSGYTIDTTCDLLAVWLDGQAVAAFGCAVGQHRKGRALGDALDDQLGAFGEPGRALASLLASFDEDGAAVADSLADYADRLRDSHRRDLETAARQLPVRMLGPLIGCVLPSFITLTVVPVVVDSITTLLA